MIHVKYIRGLFVTVLLRLYIGTVYAALPSAFLVKVTPDSFQVEEPVDLTITAVNSNSQPLQDYNGDIFIEIVELQDSNDYVLPNNGIYFFTPQDLGSKTFSKGLQIKKNGTYTIRVYDIINDDIQGETTVIVGQPQQAASENITINSPIQGGTETSSTVTVLASAGDLPNAPYQMLLNGEVVTSGTTSAQGEISAFVTISQTGSNTLQIKILDASNVVIGQSSQRTFTYESASDGIFESIQIVPSTQLKQGDKPVFTVTTNQFVTSVSLDFPNNKTYPMDKIADGSFSKQVLLEEAGTISLGATIVSQGNTKQYTDIASLIVSPNVTIGQTKYYTTSVDKTSITIEREVTGEASRYRVDYGTDQNNLNQTTQVATTGIVVQGMDPDGIYYFQIYPLDIAGAQIGTPSDIFQVDVRSLSAPITCVVDGIELITQKIGNNYFLIRDSVENATKYIIYRSDTPVSVVANMQRVGETTETRFSYPFNRYAEENEFAYYAVQALCANDQEIMIDSVQEVQVGPIDTILLAVLLAMLCYISYRLYKQSG